MSIDIRNMKVNNIISHLIFKRSDDGTIIEPHYSQALITLDDKMKTMINERISGALGKNSKSMEMEIFKHEENTTFDYIKKIMDDESSIVEHSQALTYKLAESQTSKHFPGGAVIIFKGTIGALNNDFIGIIKAEKHDGLNIIEEGQSITLELLSNLILTPQQKLYKIGIFVKEVSGVMPITHNHFKAVVFDTNMSQGNMFKAAQYFYEVFLGLTHVGNSKKLTNDFYHNTKMFIFEQRDLDDEEKLDIVSALHTYLKTDSRTTINLNDFAEQYFKKPEIKDNFRSYMVSKKIPATDFFKDNELIKNSLKRRKYKFSNNIKIEVPYESIEGKMKVIEQTADKTVIEIYGIIIEN